MQVEHVHPDPSDSAVWTSRTRVTVSYSPEIVRVPPMMVASVVNEEYRRAMAVRSSVSNLHSSSPEGRFSLTFRAGSFEWSTPLLLANSPVAEIARAIQELDTWGSEAVVEDIRPPAASIVRLDSSTRVLRVHLMASPLLPCYAGNVSDRLCPYAVNLQVNDEALLGTGVQASVSLLDQAVSVVGIIPD